MDTFTRLIPGEIIDHVKNKHIENIDGIQFLEFFS